MIASGRLRESTGALRPHHFIYDGLRDALADLRRMGAAGGRDRIPDGATLRAGSADPRVPALRRRLVLEGDLPSAFATADTTFDTAVERAVRGFQHRHALVEDGVVGPATLRALNVPIQTRIDQLRVNLERGRWILHDLPSTFVGVNIAGARVYLVRDGTVAFETRAIVGQTTTRTPIFSATMRYIDLNPTWTVPPGIVREILAEVRRDPSYLSRNSMRVIDSGGRTVAISAAEVSRYTAATFPYVFRQDAGPLNPLGQIKFMFPNEFNVYLHDTPGRGLFAREQRTFSHGCIRIENPLDFAELILDDPARWSRADLVSAIAAGTTRTIPLTAPIPVLVLYWTASADLHGEIHYYHDTYGRDGELLSALDRAAG